MCPNFIGLLTIWRALPHCEIQPHTEQAHWTVDVETGQHGQHTCLDDFRVGCHLRQLAGLDLSEERPSADSDTDVGYLTPIGCNLLAQLPGHRSNLVPNGITVGE